LCLGSLVFIASIYDFQGIIRMPLTRCFGGFGACNGSGTGSQEVDSGVTVRSGREEERCLLEIVYWVESYNEQRL
jgi:hypothetical protein